MWYQFTGKTKIVDGVTVRQIRNDSYNTSWIESKDNLNSDDSINIFNNSVITGNAKISGRANVKNSKISGNVKISGYAYCENAKISGNSIIEGNVQINGIVEGNSRISGYAYIPKNHLVSNCEIEGFQRHYFRINYAGIDLKTNEHKVRVGCQVHSISRWKDAEVRKRIMSRNRFPKHYEQEFLDILAEIEKKYVLDPFKKIDENIQKMKENVSEELKTETISLISNLPVIQAVQNGGPKRDKNGRFSKKTP